MALPRTVAVKSAPGGLECRPGSRDWGLSWAEFLRFQAQGIRALAFFTAEGFGSHSVGVMQQASGARSNGADGAGRCWRLCRTRRGGP